MANYQSKKRVAELNKRVRDRQETERLAKAAEQNLYLRVEKLEVDLKILYKRVWSLEQTQHPQPKSVVSNEAAQKLFSIAVALSKLATQVEEIRHEKA